MEITQSKQQTDIQIEICISTNRCANLCATGVPKGEERDKEIKNVFEEIMAENFPNLRDVPNLKKETDI